MASTRYQSLLHSFRDLSATKKPRQVQHRLRILIEEVALTHRPQLVVSLYLFLAGNFNPYSRLKPHNSINRAQVPLVPQIILKFKRMEARIAFTKTTYRCRA